MKIPDQIFLCRVREEFRNRHLKEAATLSQDPCLYPVSESIRQNYLRAFSCFERLDKIAQSETAGTQGKGEQAIDSTVLDIYKSMIELRKSLNHAKLVHQDDVITIGHFESNYFELFDFLDRLIAPNLVKPGEIALKIELDTLFANGLNLSKLYDEVDANCELFVQSQTPASHNAIGFTERAVNLENLDLLSVIMLRRAHCNFLSLLVKNQIELPKRLEINLSIPIGQFLQANYDGIAVELLSHFDPDTIDPRSSKTIGRLIALSEADLAVIAQRFVKDPGIGNFAGAPENLVLNMNMTLTYPNPVRVRRILHYQAAQNGFNHRN